MTRTIVCTLVWLAVGCAGVKNSQVDVQTQNDTIEELSDFTPIATGYCGGSLVYKITGKKTAPCIKMIKKGEKNLIYFAILNDEKTELVAIIYVPVNIYEQKL